MPLSDSSDIKKPFRRKAETNHATGFPERSRQSGREVQKDVSDRWPRSGTGWSSENNPGGVVEGVVRLSAYDLLYAPREPYSRSLLKRS